MKRISSNFYLLWMLISAVSMVFFIGIILIKPYLEIGKFSIIISIFSFCLSLYKLSSSDSLVTEDKNDKKTMVNIMKEKEISLIKEFERNPELFNKVVVELRKRKINKIKSKI